MFKKPATLNYPVKPREYDPIVRGHIEIEIEKCIFCGMCQRKCPTGAIKVERAEKRWAIEPFDCIQCNNCAESCPKDCLHMHNTATPANENRDLIRDARISVDAEDNKDS
ncbi:MAG: 4Fe-4S dicluster domain-containing protein [Bacillota bacterium]|nr:4Fe-4S dicluster domain-containing protein [Bacillota bacterium]